MTNPAGRPRPARRRVALALLALATALGAPAGAAASPGAQIDLADVGDRAIHLASTFTSESLVVTNTSTAGEGIAAIAIDLADGPAMFPDLVFDPAGGAGDTQGKGVTLDSVTGIVVLANPPAYRTPVGAGYASVIVTFPVDEADVDAFGDFAPGSAARFSFDVDPTSIQGTPPDPVPAAAPVSGAELHGATVAVTFSDGSILAGDLVLTPGTDNSSHLTLAPAPPLARPTLARAGGRAAPAVTFDPSQEITVTGPAGASGVMVVAEGHLNVVDAPGGGTDLDPFEANTVAAIAEVPFTIGADGTASVEVTLSDTPGQLPLLPLESGINHLTAHLVDHARTGLVSDPLVLRLDPDAERVPPAVAVVFPADRATGVPLDEHPRITFSEPMDPGTVTGAIHLTGPGGPVPVTVVSGGEATEFTIVPDAPLGRDGSYTAIVQSVRVRRGREPDRAVGGVDLLDDAGETAGPRRSGLRAHADAMPPRAGVRDRAGLRDRARPAHVGARADPALGRAAADGSAHRAGGTAAGGGDRGLAGRRDPGRRPVRQRDRTGRVRRHRIRRRHPGDGRRRRAQAARRRAGAGRAGAHGPDRRAAPGEPAHRPGRAPSGRRPDGAARRRPDRRRRVRRRHRPGPALDRARGGDGHLGRPGAGDRHDRGRAPPARRAERR